MPDGRGPAAQDLLVRILPRVPDGSGVAGWVEGRSLKVLDSDLAVRIRVSRGVPDLNEMISSLTGDPFSVRPTSVTASFNATPTRPTLQIRTTTSTFGVLDVGKVLFVDEGDTLWQRQEVQCLLDAIERERGRRRRAGRRAGGRRRGGITPAAQCEQAAVMTDTATAMETSR
jgi:hypothetical protein